jgi:hypothetical protein
MKKQIGIGMLAVMVALTAGCGDSEKRQVEKPIVKVSPTPTPMPFTFPLTGIGTETQVTTRPYVVMVENMVAARPQSGLDKADLVYEILAEGDITRFVAVYQSETADKIGPVRSMRPYFAEIARGLQGAYFHAGGSQDAFNFVKRFNIREVDQIYGGSAYFWRAKDRKMPHNLYTSSALLNKALVNKGWNDPWQGQGFTYSKDPATSGGETVNTIKINYINNYYVGYEWDAKNKQFIRTMLGSTHKDRETGKALVANNIIVSRATHRIVDSYGRRDVNVIGPGSGYLLQEGRIIPVTWKSAYGHIRVYDGAKELTLVPGKTWIHVIPTNVGVSWK